MAFQKITLTEDHIRLIRNFRFKDILISEDGKEDKTTYAPDVYGLYGGSYALEDISYALGRYEEHVPESEFEPEGVRFEPEFEEYMWGLHEYIMENLEGIEEIVHQFAFTGVTAGTYKSRFNSHVWTKVD